MRAALRVTEEGNTSMQIEDIDQATLKNFPDHDGHQKIRNVRDEATGLNAYIGVHNTNLGPALGGCRMLRYPSDKDAIRDVLRLSRGMTYKNALAGLPLGGGKSVIIADPFKDKTEAMMEAMGRAIESLAGTYITAEDSGTNERDMTVIARQTSYVLGLPDEKSGLGGNPSPATAWGVFNGIKACVSRRYGSEDLGGLTVAVQGLGAVGMSLCRHLVKAGAKLAATDMRPEVMAQAQAEFGNTLRVVAPDGIFSVEANIFAPCALGAQINDQTIPQFKFDIIAGAANNQLAEARHGDVLAERGILYAPDYAINAGGVIAVSYEYFSRSGRNPFPHELSREAMMNHVAGISKTLGRIFSVAEARKLTPAKAADELAESLFKSGQQTARVGIV